jgi:hypothetical protein
MKRSLSNLAPLLLIGPTIIFGQIKTPEGKAVCLLDITDKDRTIGQLCIKGEAAFGPGQRLAKGSGYLQASKNEYVSVVLKFRYRKVGAKDESVNELSLHVNRIDWDVNGTTTHVAGIKPVAEDWFGNKLQVRSNLENPTLTNGILTLDIEKIGKLSVDIRFGGYGVPLDPSFPTVSSKIVGDKVFQY